MTTAAAIDRVVHHAIILELTGPSYRTKEARKRNKDLNVDVETDNDGKESEEQ